MKAKVVAVNISEKKGIIKHPVPLVKCIQDYGIENDAHAGPGIRQVSLLGVESIKKFEEIKNIKGLCSGKFAENITTQGITLYKLPIGTRLKIGETIHEVSQIGKKCHANQGCEIAKLFGHCVMPLEGIFTKVIAGGIIKPGDSIEII
ncbi:MAG: MOSC domain-containing protein [Clostridiales bacterium]|jgi:MOSC domain-containing protein YiiM|nr:MOSC domain-containing protein [Clostridiales bacterium]